MRFPPETSCHNRRVASDDQRAAALPEPNAAILLIALGRRAAEQLDERLRSFELSYRHLSALGHLNREPGISYSELGRRVGVAAQSMQATIIHLEERGAVTRTSARGRGRSAELVVTDKGRTLLASGMKAVSDTEGDLLRPMTATEGEALRENLLRLSHQWSTEPRG